jgi:uncharacterized protein (DUF885 family)
MLRSARFRFLFAVFAVYRAVSVPAATAPANPDFDAVIDGIAAELVRLDPGLATTTQYFSGAEEDALDRQLTARDLWGPLDAAGRAAQAEIIRRGLERLQRFAPNQLTPTQRVSLNMSLWKLRDLQRTSEFADQGYVFKQIFGLQIGVVNLLTQTHPIRNPRDVENYLARLGAVAPVLDQGITEARRRAMSGIVPPKFILQGTIDGLDRFLAAEPGKNVFVTSLAERAAKVDNVPVAIRNAAVASAEKLVRDAIIPAFRRVRSMLAEQLKAATDDAGYWKLPRGAAAYTAFLASYTTTNLTPEEVHAIGLKEVARIEAEMDKILRELGYTEGAVKERYTKLNASLIPPADPDPRPAIIAQYSAMVRDAERRAAALFDLRPKAPVEVRREPIFTEKGAAAHYTKPAPDGSRPGIFWAPLADLTPDILWIGAGMKSVAYHEAVPGHHFQLTLQQELPEIPRFRQKQALGSFTAFSEGWGLYAERLAAEAGWYDGDSQGRLGQLNAELFRARRLVVDTGLHVKHWTRQQAIDYGIQASEVERYIVTPGQACSYMIGELKILELRAKAQRALGTRFSLKEFHNVVLRTGTVPLEVLSQVVEEWIVGQSGSR